MRWPDADLRRWCIALAVHGGFQGVPPSYARILPPFHRSPSALVAPSLAGAAPESVEKSRFLVLRGCGGWGACGCSGLFSSGSSGCWLVVLARERVSAVFAGRRSRVPLAVLARERARVLVPRRSAGGVTRRRALGGRWPASYRLPAGVRSGGRVSDSAARVRFRPERAGGIVDVPGSSPLSIPVGGFFATGPGAPLRE